MVSSKYKVTKEEKVSAENWFSELRDNICSEFQNIEKNISNNTFQIKNWKRDGGGGGKMSVMKGDVFEKVGVNISTVHGKFSEQFRKNIPGAEKDGKFWASGISVVAHPKNPFVPAAHMNTRLISTSKSWFGGGGDITPMKPTPEMSKLFHKDLKNACDKHNKEYYKKALMLRNHGITRDKKMIVKKKYNSVMTEGDKVITISKFIDDHERLQ